jgi:glucose-1-phosphate thymidylyltransferase
VIINYADTLMETDFSFIADEKADVVVWVKPVQDPRRFGVAELDGSGWVTRLIEKPDSMENNLVVVGCYFFKSGEDLVAAFEEQFRRKLKRKGEYFLVDAVNIMIENGARVRTNEIAVWLDVGTIESTLETNRYMLEHGKANKTMPENQDGVRIVPPGSQGPRLGYWSLRLHWGGLQDHEGAGRRLHP